MKTKKLISLAVAMCLAFVATITSFTVLAEATVPSDPTMPTTEVKINLSELTTDIDTDDYMVKGTSIWLKRRDVTYVLSGTTDKKLTFSNNPTAYESKTFSIVLNGASLGDITNGNYHYWSVNLKLTAGTVNTVDTVILKNLHIFGTGTLNSSYVAPVQATDSTLTVTDATVKMEHFSNSVSWNGKVLLNGKSNVTIIAGNDNAVLSLGFGGKTVLTLANTAKLTLTHDNPDYVSQYAVDGLAGFSGSEVILTDSSYLSVSNIKTDGNYAGSGIILYSDSDGGSFTMQDNATCDVTAYGSFGLFATKINVNGGNLNVKNSDGHALYGVDNLTVKNAKVITDSNSKHYGICVYGDKDTLTVKNSWIVTNAIPYINEENITDSVFFGIDGKENEGTVFGNAVIPCDVTVPSGSYLEIPSGTTLTVPKGVTLTNNGNVDIDEDDAVINNGTITDNNCGKIWEKDDTHYWWHCRLCGHTQTKSYLPSATYTGSNEACHCEDYVFSFTLPSGATLKGVQVHIVESTYDVDSVANGDLHSVTVPHKLYENLTELDVITVSIHYKLSDGYNSADYYRIALGHHGGTATCTEKAKCEACNTPYGDIDPDGHSGLKYVEAKPATVTEDGNIAYWYCSDCGKRFSGEDGKNELKPEDTVIAKLNNSKPTGDSNPIWICSVLVIVSGCALACTTAYKRKKFSVK